MTATINASTTAGVVITPDNSGNIQLLYNGVAAPTFSYYQSSAQTLPTTTFTKLTFTSNDWDTTGGMFASSRFTPTVAGYYLITGGFEVSASTTPMIVRLFKNGGSFKAFTNTNPIGVSSLYGSAMVYCNGSSDYVELYGWVGTGQALNTGSGFTYFQGTLIRSA
jgi:hypothetical protein